MKPILHWKKSQAEALSSSAFERGAHAVLDRVTHIASDLESAKVKASSFFDTMNMPRNPDGLRILD